MDELVGGAATGAAEDAAAGAAPEGPGHGVEEGGLAVAVVAGEACDLDALQVELDGVAVAEEVLDAESQRDHGTPPWGPSISGLGRTV